MPGFNAHYLFGNEYIQQLNNNYIKQCCKKHPTVFSLGLQGPDIFFYFYLSGLLGLKNVGSITHMQGTDRFFHYMYQVIEKNRRWNISQKEIAVAYMAGFLGHFVLDTNIHPFIYARTDFKRNEIRYYGRHVFLETDIDKLLLEQYTGLKPSEFRQEKTIRMNREERFVVRHLLYDTIQKTFPGIRTSPFLIQGAFYAIMLGCRLLRDKQGRKKAWVRWLEEKILGFPLISPLISSDTLQFCKDPLNLSHEKWSNPWDRTTVFHTCFMELYDRAGQEYLSLLLELNQLLITHSCRLSPDFFRQLMNRSYHSGLGCHIPS